jgi:hypothetical protein
MKERCDNPNGNRASSYFAKGITYDERWNSFTLFLEDMGERPENMSLDRINNNANYSKENCRWATNTEQSRNTSRNVFYLIDGINYCQEQAREIMGVTIKKLRYMRQINTLPTNVKFLGKL